MGKVAIEATDRALRGETSPTLFSLLDECATGNGGCDSIEAIYGLDPIRNVASNHPAAAPSADATRRGLAAVTCLPYARSALDVLTAVAPHHQEVDEDEFSGIATLAWAIDESVNSYATYSRGHKAGGFNLDRVFSDAGFEWRLAGCSMCLGMNPDVLGPGERCASTSNRNFEGRQGRLGRTHLMSPAMAAAAAITGHIVDVREWS